MYLIKTPVLVQNLIPGITWKGNQENKTLYLTFDDGPIPEITPWVLDLLGKFNAHATFFCVGDNIDLYPEIFKRIEDEGHSVGNHTQNHLDGWATPKEKYLENVFMCANRVKSNLFRPPYGRLTKKQYNFIKQHYEIVLWHVLSGDFDDSITPDECLENVISNCSEGSIVVFHDSLKAWSNLQYVLPQVLTQFANKGYQFKALRERPLKKIESEKQYYSLS